MVNGRHRAGAADPSLEDLARQVLTAATDPVARAWQSVTDARRLAQAVRALAPPAGDLAQVPATAAAAAGRRGLGSAAPDAA